MRDPYYRWQAGSTLPCSKIDIVNTAEYLEHHQSNLNPKKRKKVRDPHFRRQAGSSLPCHSFHRMWVSGASITTLNHKKRALVLSDVQCISNVPPSWSFLNGLLNHVVKELNVEEALKSSILVVHKAVAVPLSWCFLNGLLNHVVKELNNEEVLKSSNFVVQKAAAPKNGVLLVPSASAVV